MVHWVEPGGSLPDGADRLPVYGDSERLGAVRVELGAAAALAGERTEQPDDLSVGLVAHCHVEGPHVAAPKPVAEPGVLLGPVENLLPGPGDGEPVLLLAPRQNLAGLDLLLYHELTAGLERSQPRQHWGLITLVRVEDSTAEIDFLSSKSGLCSDRRHFLERRQQVGRGAGRHIATHLGTWTARNQQSPPSHSQYPHSLVTDTDLLYQIVVV